jgi:hypothetical protein
MLENSLQVVLDRLEERAKTKSHVDLLPLPTGPKDLSRLKRIFRYSVYRNFYRDDPITKPYLESGIRDSLKNNPHFVDEELAKIAAELEARPAYVYANRDKGFTWEGLPVSPEVELGPDLDTTGDAPAPDSAPDVAAVAASSADDER